MICTRCGEKITPFKGGYFKTKKGFHHFKCGINNLPDLTPACSVCGRKDREGPDGGRRVGPVPEWNEKAICLPCAAWRALRELEFARKDSHGKGE